MSRYAADVAALARKDVPWLRLDEDAYFGDIQDHLAKAWDTLEDFKDVVDSLAEANDSLTSHRTNQVIRALTSWSIILMSVTFIAGVYGMNFDPDASPFNMPELNAAYGYPLTLLGMALLSGGLVLLFRRKGWL